MFSVVIPLFNNAQWIERCVKSVLTQNDVKFEVIVVDDGSTDGGGDLVNDIDDERLKVLVKQNEGVGAARNTGVEAAIGEWVAFLDADDMWCQGHLSELNRIIDLEPGIAMASTSVIPTNEISYQYLDPEPEQGEVAKVDYFAEASKRTSIVQSSSVAIRSDVFRKLGGFTHHKMGEDLRFWALVALHGYSLAVSTRKDVFYFQDTGGVTKKLIKKERVKVYQLKDLSPTLDLIQSYSNVYPEVLKDSSIRMYINSRVFMALEVAVLETDYARALNISKLYVGRMNKKQFFFFLLVNFRLGRLLKGFFLAHKYG